MVYGLKYSTLNRYVLHQQDIQKHIMFPVRSVHRRVVTHYLGNQIGGGGTGLEDVMM